MHSCFRPYTQPRPCRYCHHLIRLEPASGTALCGHGGGVLRTGQPAYGCAFWEREPGSDDDLETAAEVVATFGSTRSPGLCSPDSLEPPTAP